MDSVEEKFSLSLSLSEPSQQTIQSSNCSFNASSVLPESWCLDDDKVPRYVGERNRTEGLPDIVEVQRYNHDGYTRCLANKTVVFVGDSRVRYQFLHLVNFLVSKRQMRCQDFLETNNHSSELLDPKCHLINHVHHLGSGISTKDWNKYYIESNAMLTKQDEQVSLCDCFRSSPFRPQNTYENRFLRRQTPYGAIKLVYLQNFQNLVRMNKQYPPFVPFDSPDATGRCEAGSCSTDNRVDAFSGNLNETLWTILPLLNATHAFVNLGWEYLFPFEKEKDLSCTLEKFEEDHADIEVSLINHVPRLSFGETRSYDSTQLDCPCSVLNRWEMARKVPKNWYWDDAHVLSIMNEEFNHRLVEQICPMNNDI